MKITVDFDGFLSQIDARGTQGFFEKSIYWRFEDVTHNEAKKSIVLRLTAVAVTADGMGAILECIEDCGVDYNGKYAGTEKAHKLHGQLAEVCKSRGLSLLSGRIEAH